uniref:Uncharacterized protein n=1 Tax=Candidatus Kentrum sp. LFY TaxID=2126342 RepID=A0A450WKD3_9GAMM|nr:MAG: hypothetical protein BECKLFY1418C_GA0070996_10326 [Candidatus Kentron sp. LFY]
MARRWAPLAGGVLSMDGKALSVAMKRLARDIGLVAAALSAGVGAAWRQPPAHSCSSSAIFASRFVCHPPAAASSPRARAISMRRS